MKAIKPKIKSKLFQVITQKANHDPKVIDKIEEDLAYKTRIYKHKITRLKNNRHVNWDVYELAKIALYFKVPFEALVDIESID